MVIECAVVVCGDFGRAKIRRGGHRQIQVCRLRFGNQAIAIEQLPVRVGRFGERQRFAERRRTTQRDLGRAGNSAGQRAAHIAAVSRVVRAAESWVDNEGIGHSGWSLMSGGFFITAGWADMTGAVDARTVWP